MTPSFPRLTPFGREQRPDVVDQLTDDPEVQRTAEAERAVTGESRDAIRARVRLYANEIVPQFSARLHHRIAYRLARRIATAFFRVRVGYVDEATLADIPADASVAFVINHRSNMDYVLVAFLAAEHVALSFAVGEWARIWPLDNLLRALGAFFVRRDSRDRLYRRVLERYVQISIEHGVTQGIFPEGGLSRDGRLRPPKLGLLAYATRHFDSRSGRDLVFIPVGINYDRVLEDRTLLRERDPDHVRRSKLRTLLSALGWMAKNARLYARGRLHRFGYACVNFGPPLSLRGYLGERGLDMTTLSDTERTTEIERLGTLLMEEIGRIIPVTPVSLVAAAILSFEHHAATRDALEERMAAMVEELNSLGAHVYVPRQDAQYFLEVGIRTLTLRRLVALDNGVYRVVAAETHVVRYYANAIAHFFATRDDAVRQTGAAPAARAGSRAVILVHGLARSSRSMERLGQALRHAGYDVWNWDYPSRRFGVMPLVEALDAYAQHVARASERVDFVTHSMGGLLARGVLAQRALPNAGRLVMLAPPNQGSSMASRVKDYRWARGFFGQALEDLSRSDDDGPLQRLGAPACPFGVVAGTRGFHPLQPTSYYSTLARPHEAHDGTIAVQETQLAGMTDFITVAANHTFIVDHDEAIRQTLHFLEHGRFDHPPATG